MTEKTDLPNVSMTNTKKELLEAYEVAKKHFDGVNKELLDAEKARKRVIARESRRTAFVRRSYNADISDPENYDLTINTGTIPIETAVEVVVAALKNL
mgnify:CR=1 FL=1